MNKSFYRYLYKYKVGSLTSSLGYVLVKMSINQNGVIEIAVFLLVDFLLICQIPDYIWYFLFGLNQNCRFTKYLVWLYNKLITIKAEMFLNNSYRVYENRFEVLRLFSKMIDKNEMPWIDVNNKSILIWYL